MVFIAGHFRVAATHPAHQLRINKSATVTPPCALHSLCCMAAKATVGSSRCVLARVCVCVSVRPFVICP